MKSGLWLNARHQLFDHYLEKIFYFLVVSSGFINFFTISVKVLVNKFCSLAGSFSKPSTSEFKNEVVILVKVSVSDLFNNSRLLDTNSTILLDNWVLSIKAFNPGSLIFFSSSFTKLSTFRILESFDFNCASRRHLIF